VRLNAGLRQGYTHADLQNQGIALHRGERSVALRRKDGVIAGWALLLCAVVSAGAGAAQQPSISKDDQVLIETMLRAAHDDVRKYYYDPKIRGLDWDGLYQKWNANIPKAQNVGQGMRLVTAYLSELKDSHTYLLPPQRSVRMDYGYELQEIGDACFVTQVRPGTDAAAKLHPGDQVLKLDGYLVTREDFHALRYYRQALAQLNGTVMTVRTPAGEERELRVSATEHPVIPYIGQDRWAEMMRRWESANASIKREVVESGDVAIWKLPEFNLAQDWVDTQMGKARKHKALILDLRGNGGGLQDTLLWLTGSLFDHDVKIGDRVERAATKPLTAKHQSHPFEGKLIVLVDARSASASEITACVVQLEHRGTVIGDRSGGRVMEAIVHPESAAGAFFGLSITHGNLIMTDGKSLEGNGVVPDEILLPTAADLAAGRDPVLAHAVELAGSKMDPVAAGKLFPYEWPKFK
jgi:C-terminal processing protease CtpA/Prc